MSVERHFFLPFEQEACVFIARRPPPIMRSAPASGELDQEGCLLSLRPLRGLAHQDAGVCGQNPKGITPFPRLPQLHNRSGAPV